MSLSKLPNELLQKIADYFPTEQDVYALTRTDRELYNRLIDYLYYQNLKQGSWALLWAVQACEPLTAKRMLQLGADANAPYLLSGQAQPLLSVAAGTEQTELARILLEHGADPNGRDGAGETALYSAAKNGDCETVQLLLEFGADWDVYNWDEEEPVTPLDMALQGGEKNRGVVDLLLGAGPRTGVAVESEGEVESEFELDLKSELELDGGEDEAEVGAEAKVEAITVN